MNDYKLGEIAANLENITQSQRDMKSDMKEIREAVESLRRWKAQVLGISVATSFLVSSAASVLAWAWGR